MGYYGVFFSLHYQNDKAMTESLDMETYDESQTLTVKVPVSIAYMPDQPEFQRVNGEFELAGELYRMLKQRYAKDTLTVVVVKDSGHKKIDHVLKDIAKGFTDETADGNSSSKTSVNFLKDYVFTSFAFASLSAGWSTDVTPGTNYLSLTSTFAASIIHPPERA